MNLDETRNADDGPAWLPKAVGRFVASAMVAGDVALPFHYPRLHELDSWQIGFRQHGITGERLVSSAPGAWQPGWYVIALNGFDDPFFIDIGEQARGFPVYYAPRGAGRWDALQQVAWMERSVIRVLFVTDGQRSSSTALFSRIPLRPIRATH